MKGLAKKFGAHMGRPLYYALRSATNAYEGEHPDRYDPASLHPRPALSERHLASAVLLPTRLSLLERVPKGGEAVELGVDEGQFSAEILRLAQPRTLHLVDMWGSQRYGVAKQTAVQNRFSALGQQVKIHLSDSLAAASRFADESLDFVYVDTDHSYSLTLAELEAYRPKMAPGGLLCGHDYIVGNWAARYRYGVIEAVHEFCVRHDWRIRYLTNEHPGHPSFALEAITPTLGT